MVVHGDEGLARPHVPDYDQIITAWRERRTREHGHPPAGFHVGKRWPSTRSEEYVACGGVPGHDAHALGVSFQNHDGIRDGAGQRVIWNLPHLENTMSAGISAGIHFKIRNMHEKFTHNPLLPAVRYVSYKD